MSKTLIVEGKTTFKITLPDEAKITFGPWSPGATKNDYGQSTGTLRVYENAKTGANILGVWSGVTSFRTETIEYDKLVVIQKGSTVWESSKGGYKVEEAVKTNEVWEGDPALLGDGVED